MIYNSFGDSLKRLERKLKIIGSTIENVRAFFDCGNTYQMYEHALKLEEQMEQAVLLSRTLPAYTGKPLAQAEVSNIERLVFIENTGTAPKKITRLCRVCAFFPLSGNERIF